MKTIFTLVFVTLFSSVFARNEGKLTISFVSGKNLQVYVDNRQYQSNDGLIILNNIQPGNHNIQVFRQGRNNNGNNNSRNKDRRGELLYSSTVYIRPSYHVDVMINRFGKALVDEKALNSRNGRWDDEEDEWNEGGYGSGNSYNRAMNDYDFSQLLQRMRSQWFGRLGNAKDAINKNYFYTSQIRQILELFTSENEKLELAKLSYVKIVDRQNFRQLYDLFSYSSQSELDRFTRDYR